MLDNISLSGVTLALPSIGDDLAIEGTQLSYMISAYAISFGALFASSRRDLRQIRAEKHLLRWDLASWNLLFDHLFLRFNNSYVGSSGDSRSRCCFLSPICSWISLFSI